MQWGAGPHQLEGCLEPTDFVVDTQSGPTSSKAHLCLSSNPPAECPKRSPHLLLLNCYAAFLFSLKCTNRREQHHSSSPSLQRLVPSSDKRAVRCPLTLARLEPVHGTHSLRRALRRKGWRLALNQVWLGKPPPLSSRVWVSLEITDSKMYPWWLKNCGAQFLGPTTIVTILNGVRNLPAGDILNIWNKKASKDHFRP